MKIPNIPAVIYFRIKKLLDQSVDPKIDKNINISGQKVFVGKYTYGYEHVEIVRWDEDIKIKIGRFCSMSYGLKLFCGGNHYAKHISTYPFGKIFKGHLLIPDNLDVVYTNGDLIIGNDVWIGRDVTIMSGITIGDGCVIATNSHIVKDLEPYGIYGGNPAKLIKRRFSNEIIDELLEIKWWEYDDNTIEKIYPYLISEPENASIEILKNIKRNSNKI